MTEMLPCGKCGKANAPESRFCSDCGSPLIPPDQLRPEPGATGRLPQGQILQGRYRLLHVVGQGGMGAVYLAQDIRLDNRLVAVKEMSMSKLNAQEISLAIEQFKHEANLLAKFQHPNLPNIYDYFGEAGRWYLVMSFIPGETLQNVLNRLKDHKMPMHEAVRIGIELCTVLEYLHNYKPQIIFRDLKPSNIMITPQGQVYLIDFGIARHFKVDQTKDTNYFASEGYAPLEQFGQAQTSPQSDIYALGATLHQMISGRRPSEHPFKFPPLNLDPTVPPALALLIGQMLEATPERRPASATIVKQGLERAIQLPPLPGTKPASNRTAATSIYRWVQNTPTQVIHAWQNPVSRKRILDSAAITAGGLLIILYIILLKRVPDGTQPSFNTFYNPFFVFLYDGVGLIVGGISSLLPARYLSLAAKGMGLTLFGLAFQIPAYFLIKSDPGHAWLYFLIILTYMALTFLGGRLVYRHTTASHGLVFGVVVIIINILLLFISNVAIGSGLFALLFLIDLSCIAQMALGAAIILISRQNKTP